MRDGSKPSALAVTRRSPPRRTVPSPGSTARCCGGSVSVDEPAGPKVPDAVAPVRRAETAATDEHADRDDRERRGRAHVQRREPSARPECGARSSARPRRAGRRNGVGSLRRTVHDAVVSFEAAVEVRRAPFDVLDAAAALAAPAAAADERRRAIAPKRAASSTMRAPIDEGAGRRRGGCRSRPRAA